MADSEKQPLLQNLGNGNNAIVNLEDHSSSDVDGVIRWKGVTWEKPVNSSKRFLSRVPLISGMFQVTSKLGLDGVYGEVKTKEVVALMGSSGAGKTTLMKCLALGDSHPGWIGGTIHLEGFREGVTTRMINQDVMNHLQEHLTVYETLVFSSNIRNRRLSREDHHTIVDHLSAGLKIDHLKNVPIEKCSGGERKRVAVALELTTSEKFPNVLYFLDEVTSELDSRKAYDVISFVKEEAQSRDMAVICTIHQPEKALFELFSKVIVLSNKGVVLYHGRPTDITAFLHDKCPNWENTSVFKHFYLTVLIDWASQEDAKNDDPSTHDTIKSAIGDQKISKGLLSYNNISWVDSCTRFLPVVRRNAVLRLWKDWINTSLIIGAYIFGALVTCLIYGNKIGEDAGCQWIGGDPPPHNCTSYCEDYQTLEEVQMEAMVMAEVKLVFFLLLFAGLVAMLSVSLSFSSDFKVFLNEYRNGCYSTGAYFWSKFLVEGVLQLVVSCIFALIFYTITHQPDWNTWNENFYERFVSYVLPVILTTVGTAMGVGFLVGVLFVDSFKSTIIVSTTLLLFLSFFSGFFKRTLAMGKWETWVSYCSFLRFSLEITLIGIYGNGRCQSPMKPYALAMFNLQEEEIGFRWAAFVSNMAVFWVLAVGCLFAKVKWFSRS